MTRGFFEGENRENEADEHARRFGGCFAQGESTGSNDRVDFSTALPGTPFSLKKQALAAVLSAAERRTLVARQILTWLSVLSSWELARQVERDDQTTRGHLLRPLGTTDIFSDHFLGTHVLQQETSPLVPGTDKEAS
jgi:hypothetical protein